MKNTRAAQTVIVAQLRAKSLISEPTIRKWLNDPSTVQPACAARLEAAAAAIDASGTPRGTI